MAKTDNLTDFLKDVADAIRAKKGVTNLINPQNFSDEILSISGGDVGGIINGTITEVTGSTLSGVENIRDNVFNNLNIESVVIPSNVSSIGASAFANNKISTLTINEGVTTIGESAFENNQIKTLTIPQSVTTIGESAFAGNNLTEITMESDIPPVVTDTTFPSSLQTTNVSYNGYQNYVDDENWQTYKATLVRGLAIPSTITVTVNNYLGEFVNGAVVTIDGNGQTFTGITDDNGVFVQGGLQPATYTISVAEIDGFKIPASQEIIVTENTQNNVIFTYLEKPAILPFAESSAEQIATISAEISAQNMTSAQVAETYGWNLGDKTSITLSTGEVIEMQIIGFNHDDKSDGSGKAGITLQMVNALATRYTMDDDKTGYPTSIMRTETLPTIKSTLPQEWQNVIKLVDKKSAPDSGYDSVVTVISEGLFLLAEIEVFGVITNAYKGKDEGNIYEYWSGKTAADRIKQYDTNADGVVDTATVWWLRSSRSGFPTMACAVSRLGTSSYSTVGSNNLVSFAFCV